MKIIGLTGSQFVVAIILGVALCFGITAMSVPHVVVQQEIIKITSVPTPKPVYIEPTPSPVFSTSPTPVPDTSSMSPEEAEALRLTEEMNKTISEMFKIIPMVMIAVIACFILSVVVGIVRDNDYGRY